MCLCIFAGKRDNNWQTIGSHSLENARYVFYVLKSWDWMTKKNRADTLV